ncbi:MAG: tetratricopeptide repeat protein [Myxococcota bacterium]
MEVRAREVLGPPRAGVLALFLLVVAMNANALGGELLTWDDALYVTENRRVQISSLSQLARVWSPEDALAGRFVEFFPLRDTLYALLYYGFGLATWPYHLLQIGLHGLACVGVAHLLARWIGPAGGLVGALLFAVHPVHVESVAWIAALKDPLSTLFVLGSLLAWGRWRDRGSALAWLAALACMAGALLVKSFGVLVPAMLVLTDWAFERRRLDARAVLDKVPFVALAVVALAGFLRVGAANAVMDLPPPGGTAWTGFLTMTSVYATYLGKLFVPHPLSARYVVHPILTATDPRFVVATVAIGLVWGASVAALRHTRVPLFANAWVLACLLLVLRIVQIPIEMADRYLYLPSIGFCAFAGWAAVGAWSAWPGRRPALAAAGIAVACAFVAVSVSRNLVWRTDETLWMDVAEKSPEFTTAWSSLGSYYVRHGRTAEADAALRRALDLDPDNVTALVNLGALRRSEGRLDEALAIFRRVTELEPTRAKGWNNVGSVLIEMNRPVDAEVALERALALDPSYPSALRNLGMARAQRGDRAGATEAFTRGVRAAPHDRALMEALLAWLAFCGETAAARAWTDHVRAWFPGDRELEQVLARASGEQ